MSDYPPSPAFEDKVRAALATPAPEPMFADRLRSQLAARGAEMKPAPRRLSRRLVWGVAFGMAALLIAAFFAIGPQRVATAMKQLFGYIPGVGLVDQNAPIRVLAEPVSATRDGVTVTVQEAVLSADKTVVIFTIDGVMPSAFSRDENIAGCAGNASLRLPDGAQLYIVGGVGQGWGAGFRSRFTYRPIAANMNTVTFFMPCINDTLPGKAPENWELPLRFVPAPPDMTLMPVIDVSPLPESTSEPTLPSTPPAASKPGQLTPESAHATSTLATPPPAGPTETPSPYGISLALDKFIPLDDGYYLLGHTTWTDKRITAVSPGEWTMRLLDAQGQEIPIEPADFGEAGILPEANQWLYRVYGKALRGPLTLRTTLATVNFPVPVFFALDLRPYGFDGSDGQLGTTWKTEPISLTVLGMRANLLQARYVQQGDLKGFELAFQADPALASLAVGIASGVTGGRGASGGGSSRDDQTGLVKVYALSDGKMSFPLLLRAQGMSLSGQWETTWNPPAVEASAPPTPIPQACLTLDRWKQAAANPAPLPAGLSGKLIAYGRIKADNIGPSPDNYGVFVANLDGGGRQVLGPGTWPSLSRDGAKAAYGWTDGLHVVDLVSGENRLLPGTTTNDYNPRWSPDGKQIAFVRTDDLNLYVMHVDGSGLRRVTGGPEYEQLVGWSPDGAKLYYAIPGEGGQTVKSIELATGAVQTDLVFNSKGAFAALSPDGQWLAFVERVPGKMAGGLYIARLDGSDRRLLAQLDYWGIGNPVWSPDGKWLMASVTDTDQFAPTSRPALINLDSCQAIPLKGIEGDVEGWAP